MKKNRFSGVFPLVKTIEKFPEENTKRFRLVVEYITNELFHNIILLIRVDRAR